MCYLPPSPWVAWWRHADALLLVVFVLLHGPRLSTPHSFPGRTQAATGPGATHEPPKGSKQTPDEPANPFEDEAEPDPSSVAHAKNPFEDEEEPAATTAAATPTAPSPKVTVQAPRSTGPQAAG